MERRGASVGFDFDGTLLSDCSALHRFVLKHHETRRLFIITHRSRQEISTLDAELQQHTPLRLAMFEHVISCPDRILMEFRSAQQMRLSARLPRANDLPLEKLFPGEVDFVTWKGKMARKAGCRIFVDDIPWLSKPGCDQYGVHFLSVKDFPTNPDAV